MSAQSSMYAPYRALGLVSDGCSATGCAPTVHVRGTASFVTTPVDAGRAVHLYDVMLRLRGVSRPIPEDWLDQCGLPPAARVSALASFADYTFMALGNVVGVFRNMRPVACWNQHCAPVTHMVIIANFLVTASADEFRLVVWRIPTKRKATTPRLGDMVSDVTLPARFRVSAIVHPPTYINKILVGAEDGRMLLLNLRTRKIVHIFDGFGSPITALASAPVIDVVAVGTSDGRIVMHNIRADESISTLRHGPEVLNDDLIDNVAVSFGMQQEEHEDDKARRLKQQDACKVVPSMAVSVLSFCTDGSETFVSGDVAGNLVFWDLNEQSLMSIVRAVHPGGTSIAHFLIGEPLLVTAGVVDNSLKIHTLDGPMRIARVLRSREGHRLPPTRVRFSGRDAKLLVSAGLDREVRLVSAVRDAQNRSFSQARLTKMSAQVKKRRRTNAGVEMGAAEQISQGGVRLPPVTGIATSTARRRDKDFANVVTIHAKRPEGFTWRLESGAVYRHVLRTPPPPAPLQLSFRRETTDSARGRTSAKKHFSGKRGAKSEPLMMRPEATAVAMSPCGNFAFIGSSDGTIHSYNLQSGRHQGAFVRDAEKRNALLHPSEENTAWGCAHEGPVSGLASDACGDVLASSGSGDSMLLFWNMTSREPTSAIVAPAGITMIAWSRSSDLVAASCEDFGIYVYDASTQKMARRLAGHIGAVTDVAFDGEGRHLVSSSMDGTIRTWDLPSGLVIDTLRCENAPTSVAIAPGGEFLATCHVNSLSVALWVDKRRFAASTRSQVKRIRQAEILSDGKASTVPEDDGQGVELPGAFSGYDHEELDDQSIDGDDRASDEDGVDQHAMDFSYLPDDQLSPLAPELVTLSGQPTTQWTTLANLDAIKQRNKPIQPPKKPETVPFFIPTIAGVKPKFDVTPKDQSGKEQDEQDEGSIIGSKARKAQVAEGDDFFGNSEFGSLVAAGTFASARELLTGASPSKVDIELRTLEGERSRLAAAEYFAAQLDSRRDFELHQAHLDVFLKAHGRDLIEDEGGCDVLSRLGVAQRATWDSLHDSFDAVLTLSGHFSGQVQI